MSSIRIGIIEIHRVMCLNGRVLNHCSPPRIDLLYTCRRLCKVILARRMKEGVFALFCKRKPCVEVREATGKKVTEAVADETPGASRDDAQQLLLENS